MSKMIRNWRIFGFAIVRESDLIRFITENVTNEVELKKSEELVEHYKQNFNDLLKEIEEKDAYIDGLKKLLKGSLQRGKDGRFMKQKK